MSGPPIVAIAGTGVTLWYSPLPASGCLVGSRTEPGKPGGADQYGNPYPAGTWLADNAPPCPGCACISHADARPGASTSMIGSGVLWVGKGTDD